MVVELLDGVGKLGSLHRDLVGLLIVVERGGRSCTAGGDILGRRERSLLGNLNRRSDDCGVEAVERGELFNGVLTTDEDHQTVTEGTGGSLILVVRDLDIRSGTTTGQPVGLRIIEGVRTENIGSCRRNINIEETGRDVGQREFHIFLVLILSRDGHGVGKDQGDISVIPPPTASRNIHRVEPNVAEVRHVNLDIDITLLVVIVDFSREIIVCERILDGKRSTSREASNHNAGHSFRILVELLSSRGRGHVERGEDHGRLRSDLRTQTIRQVKGLNLILIHIVDATATDNRELADALDGTDNLQFDGGHQFEHTVGQLGEDIKEVVIGHAVFLERIDFFLEGSDSVLGDSLGLSFGHIVALDRVDRALELGNRRLDTGDVATLARNGRSEGLEVRDRSLETGNGTLESGELSIDILKLLVVVLGTAGVRKGSARCKSEHNYHSQKFFHRRND